MGDGGLPSLLSESKSASFDRKVMEAHFCGATGRRIIPYAHKIDSNNHGRFSRREHRSEESLLNCASMTFRENVTEAFQRQVRK